MAPAQARPLIADRQLSTSLRLSAWPCWEHATESDLRWLSWTARNVWEPVIARWGPLYFTSWKRWVRSGCVEARTGDHAHPGTLDVVPARASVEEVHSWMGAHIRDGTGSPLFGSLINVRDHIHYTPPGVGTAAGVTEFLSEPTEGKYRGLPLPFGRWTWRGMTLTIAAALALYFFATDRRL